MACFSQTHRMSSKPNKGTSVFRLFSSSSKNKRSMKQSPSTQLSFSNEKQSLNSSKLPQFQPTLEEMKWIFNKFDSNKDGKISFDEYKSAQRSFGNMKEISEAEAAKSFGFIDSDGDGFVDFKEFMELYSISGGEVKVGDIESAFKVYDSNGDGKISAEEVMEIMKRIGEGSNLKACRKMVKGVDGDGDGFVDFKEFTKMMSSNSIKFHN